MIKLLGYAFFAAIAAVWVLLSVIFFEQGKTTWKMGDKVGALAFFGFDIAVLIGALVLLCL